MVRVNLSHPEKLENLLARAAPDGHLTVASLVRHPEPEGRTSERTLGRIPGDSEDPEADLRRLLVVDGVGDDKVELRLRAYRDKEKLGEAKVVARLTTENPLPSTGSPEPDIEPPEISVERSSCRPLPVSSPAVASPAADQPSTNAIDDYRLLRLELLDLRTGLRGLNAALNDVHDRQRDLERRLDLEERCRSDGQVQFENDFDRFCAEIEPKVGKGASDRAELAAEIRSLEQEGAEVVERLVARLEGIEERVGVNEATLQQTAESIDLLVDQVC